MKIKINKLKKGFDKKKWYIEASKETKKFSFIKKGKKQMQSILHQPTENEEGDLKSVNFLVTVESFIIKKENKGTETEWNDFEKSEYDVGINEIMDSPNIKLNKELVEFYEELNEMIIEDEKFLNKSEKFESIYFVSIYDADDPERKSDYAFTFGYSGNLIKDYTDEKFPFIYISNFDKNKIKSTYIRFPFSNTNKTLSSHLNIERVNNRVGSFISQIDLEISGIPARVSENLSSSKLHSASESLVFTISKGDGQKSKLTKILEYLVYIEFKLSSGKENKYNIMTPVKGKEKQEIESWIFDATECSEIEAKSSVTGLMKDDATGSFNTAIWLNDCEIISEHSASFNSKIWRSKDYLNEFVKDLEINDDTLEKIVELYNSSNIDKDEMPLMKFIKEFKVKTTIDGYTEQRYIGRLINFYDLYFKYKNEDYIFTDGNYFKLEGDINKLLNDSLTQVNEITRTIDSFDSEELIGTLKLDDNLRSLDSNGEVEENCPRLYYTELIFNYALVRSINSNLTTIPNLEDFTKSEKALLLDRKTTNDSKIEVSDLALIRKEGNKDYINFVHVKFDFDNKDIAYNIDQSIASAMLIKNKDKEANEVIKSLGHDFKVENVNEISLLFVLKEKNYNSLMENGKPDWRKLNGKVISKFKLTEWLYEAYANNLKPSIYVIKENLGYTSNAQTRTKRYREIIDPNNELTWKKTD